MAMPADRHPAAAKRPSPPPAFKASELPLPSATRSAIESLARSFKKEGAYDSIRKQVWDKFEASVRPTPHHRRPLLHQAAVTAWNC